MAQAPLALFTPIALTTEREDNTDSRIVVPIAESNYSPHEGVTVLREGDNSTSQIIMVDDSALRGLQPRPPLTQYIRGLWKRRHFIIADARAKSFSNSRGNFLGPLWVILDPLIQVSVYALVFGLILKISRGMENYIGFLVIGVVFFGFFSKGITAGSGLMHSSKSLVTSFAFPKASICFSNTTRQFLDNLFPALIAVLVALSFQPDLRLTWSLLLIIPLYILVHFFCAGCTLIITRATAFVPDLKSVVNVGVRGLFFVSGVFYSVDRFATEPVLRSIMVSNPIYQFFHIARTAVLDGQIAPLENWVYVIAWAVGLFLLGFYYFWRAEDRYVNVF